MLLVVSPNLAIDRILEVDGFRSSAVQRSRQVRTQPGGKGSNVARVFRQLGGDVILTGFVGRRNGSWIVEPLRSLGVRVDTIEGYSGESRTCTIICDTSTRDHPTVINEESPEIEANAKNRLLETIEAWLPRVRAIIVTGSLSRGLDQTFYRDVLARARSRGLYSVIDATGAALCEGLQAEPSLLKVNLEEARATFGDLSSDPREAAEHLIRQPKLRPHTIITFGEKGALLVRDGSVLFASPPQTFHVNPIGAGDTFAAAFVNAILAEKSPEDALLFATAAAASDANTIEPGNVVVEEVRSLLGRVTLNP
jgi:1-phosphofructokinase family hexose kinase